MLPATTTEGREVEKLSYEEWNDITMSMWNEPEWRLAADRAADYYDDNQLNSETLARMRDRGISPLVFNVVKPVINVALGMEARNRTDWRVAPDGNGTKWDEVASALNEKMHEAERKTRADRACSDAYAGQLKAGLHWVGVTRETNPYEYRYRVEAIHRREILWDWTDTSPDLRNANWLVRQRWFDTEVLARMLPGKASLIRQVGSGWPGMRDFDIALLQDTGLAQSFDQERRFFLPELEWRYSEGSTRQRVRIFEVWYRRWSTRLVMRLPDGNVVPVDRNRFDHMQAIAAGVVEIDKAVFPEIRVALWMGPHQLVDAPSPYRPNRFPYIPFWGYREDLTGVPYGLIRSMMSPQDEVNARRSKMMWLLSAKRLIADSDAFDLEVNSIDQVLEELTKPNAAIWLNPKRTNRDAIKVEQDFQLGNEQAEMYHDAKQMVNMVAGVHQPMMGDARAQPKSGVAIDHLIQQGITTLAEINDNYTMGRRDVGEALLHLIKQDMLDRNDIPIEVGTGKARRTILLNQRVIDERTGRPTIVNRVDAAQVKVDLEDVPSTATQRHQDFASLSELAKGLPPQMQAALLPAIIEVAPIKDAKKHAETMRRIIGLPEELPPDQAEQAAEQQQAMQQEQAEFQKRAATADIVQKEAKAKLDDANAQKVLAEIRNIGAEITEAAGDGEDDPRLIEFAQRNAELQNQLSELRLAAKEREIQLASELGRERIRIASMEDGAAKQREAEKAQGKLDQQRQRDADTAAAALKEVAKALSELRKEFDARDRNESKREAQPPKVELPAIHIHAPASGSKKVTITGEDGKQYTIERNVKTAAPEESQQEGESA